MEDLTGKQFGHYQIVAPLGEGGMAAVFKAYQPSMERYVAIKVLPRHMASSEEFLSRFRREAKLLAQLQHPHILPVFDYGEADGYTYIVMPFVKSGTLTELIYKQSLPLSQVRRIMTQIGEALSYAHARGMIHRDIKPSNVLIDERGNCLLTDFGLARMAEASIKITTSGAIMGTPAYMSPEQGAGSDVDHRSDLYSLGVILYEMVTGRVPYTAETPIAIVFKHIQDPLPSPRKLKPDLPEAIELTLLKSLAKDPNDRYQSADEFVRAIHRAIPEASPDDKDSMHAQAAPIETVLSRPTADKSPVQAMPIAATLEAKGEETAVEKPATAIAAQPQSAPQRKGIQISRRLRNFFIVLFIVAFILIAGIGWAKSQGYLVTATPSITQTSNISNMSTSTSADAYFATTSFTQGQDVYVSFNIKYVQADTPFEARWYYEVNILRKEMYFLVATSAYASNPRDSQIYLYLEKPERTGSYRVDIYMKEDLVGARYFSVK